jgi:hypothetical protein
MLLPHQCREALGAVNDSMTKRVLQCWSVLTGKATAVSWEQLSEILEAPHSLNTVADITKASHAAGLHKNSVPSDCQECFEEIFERYSSYCIELLQAVGLTDQIEPFMTYLNDLVSEDVPLSEKIMISHTHELYMVGDFLGYDHNSAEFKDMTAKYDIIRVAKDREALAQRNRNPEVSGL